MKSVRRRKGTDKPAVRFVVFTEGMVTEPEYLSLFNKCFGNRSIKLELRRGLGVPLTLVNKAIEEKKNQQSDPLGIHDKIRVVFDVDEHPNLNEAKDRARNREIHLAISNPCFEIWGIYHYRECDAPLNRHQCQKKLDDLCIHYKRNVYKSFANPALIKDSYRKAVERAEKALINRANERDPGGSPSTTVHELTGQLRLAAAQPS